MPYPIYLNSWLRTHGQKYFILIVWICGCLYLFYQTFCYFNDDPSFYYVRQILGVSMCISRGAASILNLNCGLILLPTCRYIMTCIAYLNSKVRISTVRVILESCRGFHKVCAITIILSSAVHVIGHIFNAMNYSQYYNCQYPEVNGVSYPNQNPMYMVLCTVSGISGLLMSLLLVVIVTSSYKQIRDLNYEIFYYTHRLIFIFYGLLMIHAIKGPIRQQKNIDQHWPGCNTSIDYITVEPEPLPEYKYKEGIQNSSIRCTERPQFQHIGCQSWMWILVPLMLYIVDGIIRIFNRKTTSITQITTHNGDVLKLQLKCDGFKAKPGQYVLLKCPKISLFEWHPYSITKCPDKLSNSFNLCLRHKGDWSGNIYDLYKTELQNQDIVSSPVLKVDGPYSSPLCAMNQSKVAVCIAGGIGVTPFICLLHKIRHKLGRLKWLCFVWIVRDMSHLEWFIEDILLTHKLLENNCPDILEVQFYVTNKDSENNQAQFSPESLNFIQSRVVYQRPDWLKVLSSVSNLHYRKTVDVFVCGPKQMIYDVRMTTLQCFSKRSRFRVYEESF